MTKRRRSTSENPPREQTTLLVSAEDAEAQLRDRVERASAILSAPISDVDSLEKSRAQYYTWTEYNTALLKRLFSTEELAHEYSFWGIAFGRGPSSLAGDILDLHEDVVNKVRRLESIIERLPLYSPLGSPVIGERATTSTSRAVFIVHGRNDELKETVARFLAQLDLEPVILHEQPSAGQTVIEKFEANSGARFAVVLLTPDDVGRLAVDASNELQARARQNVIFEWGFFVAKLGRRNVCALYAEGVEFPSDLNGLVYVELDHKGAWKMLLAREIKAGGIEIDLNRTI